MKTMRTLLAVLGCLCLTPPAQVPNLLNDQGRVAVGTVNFDGPGQFEFALSSLQGLHVPPTFHHVTHWPSPDPSPRTSRNQAHP